MVTHDLNLATSKMFLHGVLEGKTLPVHLDLVPKLKRRLNRGVKYPLRGLTGFRCYVDSIQLTESKRREVVLALEKLPNINSYTK